jgi:hypothetical protein
MTKNNVAYSAQVLKQRMLFLYNVLEQFKSVIQMYTKLMHMAHCHSNLIPLSFKYTMSTVQNW